MKQITTFRDIEQLGLNVLTGEACALGMRYLCDMNAGGRNLMEDFLAVNSEGFRKNWNSIVNGHPAVASVMLTRTTIMDFAEYALHKRGYERVARLESGGIVALSKEDIANGGGELLETYISAGKVAHEHDRLDHGEPGLEVRHRFTGMTATGK